MNSGVTPARVLLVEDDLPLATTIAKLLRARGHEARVAASAARTAARSRIAAAVSSPGGGSRVSSLPTGRSWITCSGETTVGHGGVPGLTWSRPRSAVR